MQSIFEYLKFPILYTLLIITLSSPFFAIAIWRVPSANRKLITLVALFLFIDCILAHLPSEIFISPYGLLWQGKLLQILWPILFVLVYRQISFSDIGMTMRINTGSLRPMFLMTLVVLLILVALIALGSRMPANIEYLFFMMIMPGLSEELIYRGVFQALLNRSFGKTWTLWGAQVGSGLILTALIFGFGHLLIINKVGDIHFQISPWFFCWGFVLGWIRERSGSLLPCVIVHGLIDSSLVVGGYLWR